MALQRLLRRGLFSAVLLGFAVSSAWAGEPQWVEVRSPNFRVYTDAGEKRGREVALHFEQMRFVFGKLMKRAKIQTGVPVRVIAFRNTKGFRSVAPQWKGKAREVAGFYLGGQGVAFVALDLSSETGWTTVFHEYAHLLLNSNVSNMPLWFDEGFAEYYSTAKIDKSQWVVGKMPEYAPEHLYNHKFIPLLQLFSAQHDSPFYNERDHATMFYAESWLAVEYFWFSPERHKQLLEYLDLRDNEVAVADAMNRAFGKDTAQLDKEFEQYSRKGSVNVTTYKTPPVLDNLEMKVAALDEIDARAVVAELRLHETEYEQAARAELQAILSQKPDQPVALRGLGYALMRQGDSQKAAAYLERAANLGSDDPRVYFYLAWALERGDGRLNRESKMKMRSALEKCIALDPEMADAYSLLGFVQAQDDFDAAVKSMQTAIRLNPRKLENQLNFASLYLGRGKFEEAAALLQPLTSSSNQELAAKARFMLQQIAEIKQRVSSSEVVIVNRPPGSDSPASEAGAAQDAEFEMKPFTGTLVKAECPSPGKLVLTVKTSEATLVLSGKIREISTGGKPLYCGMQGGSVNGYYDGKASRLLAVRVH